MASRRPLLTITFHRVIEPRPTAWWEAVRATGGKVRGGYMPIGRGVIPHDLAHLATEAHFGIDDGFWGLLARGATFKRGTDRRPTRPGRALVTSNRSGLGVAENLGNHHHAAWVAGQPTPVAASFDELAARWRSLPHCGAMVVHWPYGQPVAAPSVSRAGSHSSRVVAGNARS